MEKQREDRRIRITKLAIRESLVELMEKYPISKISVKMICETADINRSTFYAHYKDQYALLQSVQQDIVADVKEQIVPAHLHDASEDAVSVLVHVLKYGKGHAPLLRVLLSEHGDSSFHEELMQLAHEKLLEEFRGEHVLPPRTMQYLNQFALGGLLSIIRTWLDDDCVDEPEMLAELMIKLIVQGTSGLYKRSDGG